MQDPRLGEHDEAAGLTGLGAAQQGAGGSDEIRVIQQVLLALGVGEHFSVWVLELQLQQRLLAERFMHDAATGPKGEFPAALALHPTAQILIGCEQDRAIGGQLLHQIHRVAAGADQIALGFHRC